MWRFPFFGGLLLGGGHGDEDVGVKGARIVGWRGGEEGVNNTGSGHYV